MTDMTPDEIRIALIRNGNVSQADIARECNVTASHVRRVITGQSVSDRVQKAIAKAIRRKVTEVFPSRYPAGRPGIAKYQHQAANG